MSKEQLYHRVVKLHEEGYGSRRIAKMLNIKEGSIEHWIYPNRKGKTSKPHSEPNLSPSPELSYVLGALYGDGYHIKTQGHYTLRLDACDKEFVESFSQKLGVVLGKSKPYAIIEWRPPQENRRTVYSCSGYSKAFYTWFTNTPQHEIFTLALSYPYDFLRGFADSEGSVSLQKNTHIISFSNTDLTLLSFVKNTLENQGIKTTKILQKKQSYKPSKILHQFTIGKSEDVQKFYEKIGFTIKRKQLEKNILQVDIDRDVVAWGWEKDYIKSLQAVLRAFKFRVEKILKKKSPSKEGWHWWIHICGRPLNDEEKNKLQWLAGHDDLTRVHINQMRIQRGLRKYWSKLFTRHLWRKPLPKRCQRCKLREILNEMREQHGKL